MIAVVTDVVWLALIAALVSVISPVILAVLTRQGTKADKILEWNRLDTVAKNAKIAVEQAALIAKESAVKLDGIHALVNSDKTTLMQSELDSKKTTLILMMELISIKQNEGIEPTPEAITAIDSLKSKIAELEAALVERKHQTELADKATAEAQRLREQAVAKAKEIEEQPK